jgi:DNA-binding NarL/FixJ family response regulator
MGGLACLKELLRHDDSARVLVASGYSSDQQIQETMAAGAAGFIGKPYRIETLLEKVRSTLDATVRTV